MLTLPEQFFQTAQRNARKPALLYKPNDRYLALTYSDLEQAIRQVGAALIHRGIKLGDRVAILSENRPEWVIADLGSLLAGAINVPLHGTLSPRLISDILKNSECRAIFVSSPELAAKLAQILESLPQLETIIYFGEQPPDILPPNRVLTWSNLLALGQNLPSFPPTSDQDLASLIYTSGTTGEPKGVMLTHHNFLSNALAALQAVPMREGDTLLSVLPLSHIFERTGGYYAPLLGAGATVAYSKSLKEFSKNLQEVQPTMILAVPRLFDTLYSTVQAKMREGNPRRLRFFNWALKRKVGSFSHFCLDGMIFRKIRAKLGGRLRFFISGGAGLNPALAHFFWTIGLPIYEGYGLTETSPVVAVSRHISAKIGTVGPPLVGVEVRIATDGEILVRGPNVTPGYWRDPEATQALIDPEGWLHTGDLGSLDEAGLLTIRGRKKEMIVTSHGKNVWPEPLEAKLNGSPYILQSLVVGDNQNHLAALVVPDWSQLQAFLRDQHIPAENLSAALPLPQVQSLYRREIDHATQDVAEYEKILKFTLIPNEFTIEREEITPSLKQRRAVIIAHYQQQIADMYRGKKRD